MNNIIVGTSGHVDHGKTCLIKALTGMDCDRLKEEKKRGITIENGFADMVCGDYNISIIDVPGHEKFVRNMLMGIGGIDLVLLVIALDEGVMPQTREHFGILSMLNIHRGIMVFTKRDMVDDQDWVDMVHEDARELVKGTFMEGCDEIEVSSYDGYNIEALRDLIVKNIDDKLLKNDSSMLFRIPVDRVFAMEGFGTVITGTLLEGQIHTGDEVMAYPGGLTAKVRGIEVHGDKVDTAFAGQRTALNLQGVKKEDLERGIVLARPGSLKESMMLDVKLELLKDSERTVLDGSRVHFYSGASEATAKVVLLDRQVLSAGESCYAQLRLEETVALRRGDRFIIRFLSPLITIGGGSILEVSPRKHKRGDEKVLADLSVKDKGSSKEVLELVIRENSAVPLNLSELAQKQRLTLGETSDLVDALSKEQRVRLLAKGAPVHVAYVDRAKAVAEDILSQYHDANAMSSGLGKSEFLSKLGQALHQEDKKLIEAILGFMIEDRFVKDTGNAISLYSFQVKESPELAKMRERIAALYSTRRFEMPTLEEVLLGEKDQKNAKHIVESMAAAGTLVRLDYQYYIDGAAYEEALNGLKTKIAVDGKITLAEFRDIIGTSRKFAMAILDYLDASGITVKIEDYRVLK